MYHVKAKPKLVVQNADPLRSGPAPSRQQARTETTRRRLLAAAERIFARDGFEAARLEEIAAAAGYTRGAFYANFRDKEDLFFALLEHWISARVEEVNALFSRYKEPHELVRALREYYAQNAKDRRFVLLSLEFDLYAVRHPDAHTRLRNRQRKLRACGEEILDRVIKSLGRKLAISGRAASTALSALSTALFLEHIVDAGAITEAEMRHLLGGFFDSVLGVTK
jgi:AcrR family transcriptional regulator